MSTRTKTASKSAPPKAAKPPKARPVPVGRIAIQATTIVRLARFICTEETRYYLGGWRIERNARGEILVVATDGHRLGVICDGDGRMAKETRPVTLARNPAMLAACRASPAKHGWYALRGFVVVDVKSAVARLVFATDADEALAKAPDAPTVAHTQTAALVDGDYPDWRGIVPLPKQATIASHSFNPRYIGDYAAATAPTDGIGSIQLLSMPGKGEPTLVRPTGGPHDDFLGVLMPMHGTPRPPLPAWLTAQEIRDSQKRRDAKVRAQAKRDAAAKPRAA